MFPLSLFITTIFTISNFIYNENNSFEKNARLNYLNYLKTNNECDYEKNFVDNLYAYGYYDNVTSLTVLTHGLGGNVDYWFPKTLNNENQYVVDYSSNESLAYTLLQNETFTNTRIPVFSIRPVINDSYKLTSIEVKHLKQNQDGSYTFQNFEFNSAAKHIFDKHVVVIYDTPAILQYGHLPNQFVSEYFCDTLDSFLARITIYHQGKLPRLNLIGHSRGGIINLYYSQKRQFLIDNFITIASPLSGSIWANAANSYVKLCRFFDPNNLNYDDDFDGLLSYENICYHGDMLSSLNQPYKIAIGAEMTPSVFCNQLDDAIMFYLNQNNPQITFGNANIINNIFSKIREDILNNDNFLMSTIITICNSITDICNAGLNSINAAIGMNDLLHLIPFININDERFLELCSLLSTFLNDVKALCTSVSNYDQATNCIKGDFCVDLDSQIGNYLGYSNFNERVTIPFGKPAYTNFSDSYLSDINNFKVVHNYESNFPAIVNLIYSKLSSRNSIQHITIPNAHYEMDINPYQIPFYNLTSSFIEEFYSPNISFYGNEFGFRDYYYYESEVSAHPGLMDGSIEINDFEISTQRMRTGFIQSEKIVLSPNRKNAGFSFFEFYFSESIHALVLDISLWSEYELIDESNLCFAYTFSTEMRDFVFGVSELYFYHYHNAQYGTMTIRGQTALMSNDSVFEETFGFERISPYSLPTNRNCPNKLYILSNEGFSFIGFYSACNVTSLDRNKGRICLSNFGLYK